MTLMHLIDHGDLSKERAFDLLREAGFHPRMVLTDNGVYRVGVVGAEVVRVCAETLLSAHMPHPVPDVLVPCEN